MEGLIHGYHYDKTEVHYSPNGTWYKAQMNDKKYFLKKFQNPKYPKDGIDADLYESKKKECDEWFAAKKRLIKALNEIGDGKGNIISPRDVFRENLCFYQTTYWIDVETDSLDDVKKYSYNEKLMLLKTYSTALEKVHSKGIIHGDLKPDNILIGKSASGKPAAKLIDFDDSYFSKEALPPELTVVTDAYQSPELARYKMGKDKDRTKLTCSSDVFASGIIFHQFWCGDMPEYPGRNDSKFIYEAVALGEECTLDNSIPVWLQNLIQAMLSQHPEDRPTMQKVHKALIDQDFPPKKTGSPTTPSSPVDRTLLKSAAAKIPKDLSKYTAGSVKLLSEICNKISKLPANATQETVDILTTLLYSAIRKLELKYVSPRADYSKIDKILSAIPKDLTDYSTESVKKLRKVIEYIENNRTLSSQSDVDNLAKMLLIAYRSLEPAPTGDFSICPADPLPPGFSKVKILSDTRVCAYTIRGERMSLSSVAAISMGLVVIK